MNAKPQLEQSTQEEHIRAALDQHWAASDANDFETEHRIYLDDAVLVDAMMRWLRPRLSQIGLLCTS